MRKLLLGFSLVGVIALALGQGPASAQPAPGDASAAPTAAPTSPKQQLDQANAYLAEMEGIRARVASELERARKERDVVKTLCLDDKLNQIDVAMSSAAERRRGLELASGRGDSELSGHEYTILSVLYQRVQQLDSEANQCIGKEIATIGESSVSVEKTGDQAPEDPSDYPATPVLVLPPDCASCYR